jgi:phage tail sheath protein FI
MAKSNIFQHRKYQQPGVYIEEVSAAPKSIAEVETAIPVFIGYTEKAGAQSGSDLKGVAKRISSMQEYSTFFGSPGKEQGISLRISQTSPLAYSIQAQINNPESSLFYYAVQAFFANGGKSCFVISVGKSGQTPLLEDFRKGLQASAKEEGMTTLCFPDAVGLLSENDYYQLMGEAMLQCNSLRNRFLLVDLHSPVADKLQTLSRFRNGLTQNMGRSFAAAYYPYLVSQLEYVYRPEDVAVHIFNSRFRSKNISISLAELQSQHVKMYTECLAAIKRTLRPVLPPSPFLAAVYASTDRQHGVWKAPANVKLQAVQGLSTHITNQEQEVFNVDAVEGKSVNVIREFSGRGFLVWGARTLAGNDNEWRYVPVRRLIVMIETSINEYLKTVVFEPNDNNLWSKVRSVTENFLQELWKKGALRGEKVDQAFFVRVGLGHTMSSQDILEKRMVVEIGLAAVRPAEFIILRIVKKSES